VTGSFDLAVTPGDEGLIIDAREVSETRRVEEALRASEERFRTSVEALQDGFAVLSAIHDSTGTVVDFRYEYLNEALYRMNQRSGEDTVGHTLAQLFPATVTSGLLAAYARVAETGEPLAQEDVEYEDADGGQVARAFDVRVVKLGDGIVMTRRDVAERRRTQETMARQAAELARDAAELEDRVEQRTADLLRANQELEGFGYSVAHDLRAPLRAIDGYCQILLDEHAAQLDEDGQVLLGDVGRYAVRMGHLIEGMLALARIGRKDIGHVRIDMTALAESVVTDLRRGHVGAWPAITIGQLADASGAPELIRQVWENLIGNAVKFSANQADAQVSVESQEAAGEVIYHVRDNGVGFDMAYAGKLFGVFQRLHPAEFPGTGIGLAIVARIADRLGGRVWAEGRVGDGACFSFALPAPSTENGETT
jgi:signal transduction histidine kinase